MAACRGDVDAARAYAERSLGLQVVTGNEGHHIPGLALLETLARAIPGGLRLGAAVSRTEGETRHPPPLHKGANRNRGACPSRPAHGGARAPAAVRIRCEPLSARLGRPGSRALSRLPRGGNGDFPAAERLLDDAVEGSRPLGLPFELGQSLLALGVVRRRLQRKLLARETLEEARHVFDALGARLWIERVEAELRRIGGRRHPAGSSLSEIESQIAALVAMGQTNSEVASTLQISRKTVEWNLSKIYRKLRIRSRTASSRCSGASKCRGFPRVSRAARRPSVAGVDVFIVERSLPGTINRNCAPRRAFFRGRPGAGVRRDRVAFLGSTHFHPMQRSTASVLRKRLGPRTSRRIELPACVPPHRRRRPPFRTVGTSRRAVKQRRVRASTAQRATLLTSLLAAGAFFVTGAAAKPEARDESALNKIQHLVILYKEGQSSTTSTAAGKASTDARTPRGRRRTRSGGSRRDAVHVPAAERRAT